MNIIKQNPFRILGLTGNATEKELQKQIGIIKRYAEVGKTKSFDYDFEFIGDFSRTPDDIQEASNRIEQSHKKLLYSLFWFVKNTQFDEIAFNNLKENDTEKAIEIWNKTLKDQITSKNFSSYLNLSTLYIALSMVEDKVDQHILQAGISLKGNLIHSDSLKDFSKIVTGNGVSNDPLEISKKFVDELIELLKPYLNKKNGFSTNDLIYFFDSFPSSTQKYISSKFTEVPISNIENNIEKTSRQRKDNPRDAEEYGEELYEKTKKDLSSLKRMMGSENVQFQMIANKLANEVLQCSIDFFNEISKEELADYDPFKDALKVAKYAKSIKPTGQTESRVLEALSTLEEMRYRDIYEIIGFLNQIIGVFEQVEKENSGIDTLLSGRRTVVNEEKIMEVAIPLFDKQILEKIAKSDKNNLINDFYNALNKIINKISFRNTEFFNKKKTTFISLLPVTNTIKFNFEKAKLENEISNLQSKLSKTKSKEYYRTELQNLNHQMTRIKEWQLFRSRENREKQITEQNQKINQLKAKGEKEKKQEIVKIEEQLVIKRRELKELTNK